jgi:predicted DCC family thiol-disulfide oxidoreductase YuxK
LAKLPAFCRYSAYQNTDISALGLTLAEVQEQVWLIDDSRKLGGHRAVAWLLVNQREIWWRVLGALILAASPLSALIYRWVAKNRHRLPGGTKECSIDDRP